MKTLSVFDSNEDITNFVQGKIRVSGMDGRIKKMWYIFTVEFYYPIKKKLYKFQTAYRIEDNYVKQKKLVSKSSSPCFFHMQNLNSTSLTQSEGCYYLEEGRELMGTERNGDKMKDKYYMFLSYTDLNIY